MQKLAFAVSFFVATIATGFAHEGHTHADNSIPLWRIVTVVATAIGIYSAVNTILKRRERRQNLRDGGATDERASRNRE